MLIELCLRLSFSGRRATSHTMSDWIKKSKDKWDKDQKLRYHRGEVFGPKAISLWEELVSQIKNDVAELNATCEPMMKGPVEINNREIDGRKLIPHDTELHIDKLSLPSISLTIQLDIGAESIKIIQRRKETLESEYIESSERIDIYLSDSDDMSLTEPSAYGNQGLNLERASRRILERFVKS